MTLPQNPSVGSQRVPQDRVDSLDQSGFIGYNPEEESIDDRFKKLAEKNKEIESTSEFFGRNTAQIGARVVETVTGYAGNLKKAFMSARDFLEGSKPEGQKLSDLEKKAFGEPEVNSLEYNIMNPLTSSELRQTVTPSISEKLGKDSQYLEPKGEGEKALGEFSQDLASYFMPGTRNLNMISRIGAPIAGNLAKQGYKYFDKDEKNAEQVKLGVELISTLAGQSNPGRFASQRMADAKNMIPDTATVSMGPFAQRSIPLIQRMLRGFNVPSKARTVQGLRELSQQINQNGRMNMRSLMDARDHVNEWISEAGGFDIPKASKPALIRNLNELKSNIIKTIDENMSSRFPQAGELYRTGYEASAVNHQSNAISNFIDKNFGRKAASIGVKLLFPAAGVVGLGVVPKTMAVSSMAYAPYKVGQVLYRVTQSPTLARYYSNVIRDSVAGNVPGMIRSLDQLDKAMLEDERKEGKKKSKNKSLEEFKMEFQ